MSPEPPHMRPHEHLADLIESVLASHMSAAEGIAVADGFPDAAWDDRLLAEACHMLIHYREDDDIRERDPGYARCQRGELARAVGEQVAVGR